MNPLGRVRSPLLTPFIMLKGTRILTGDQAIEYNETIESLKRVAYDWGFEEVIVPTIWNLDTFQNKLGFEKEEKMWTFKDRGDRDVCLIPEVTGIIQEQWNAGWKKTMKKPAKLFYVSRCYRYDKPQEGRYREFTQFGIEVLGGNKVDDWNDAQNMLGDCLEIFLQKWSVVKNPDRGIEYYIDDTFEVECDILGAQKQIAGGGGDYKEGFGWAIGVERLILARKKYTESGSKP